MVLEMLNMLECFDLQSMGHNSVEYVRTVTEIMKRATSDKDRYIGDPAHVDVPLDQLLSKSHAREHAASIQAGERAQVERLAYEPRDTTHVCVVDKDGNAASMTHSLGMPGTSNAIDVSNGIPWVVTDALEAEGYEVIRSPRTHDFAWVHGIRVENGNLDGGADPAADGAVQIG